MAKPTPRQVWKNFTQDCSRIGFTILEARDLETLVLTSLTTEVRMAGVNLPPPTPIEVRHRKERFADAIQYLEENPSRLVSKDSSVIAVLGEIMVLERKYGIGKDYCTTVAASFLEALPYLLSEKEFGGADQGIEQIPVYSLDLILRAAQTEISEFNKRFQSCQNFPGDQIADEVEKVAGKLVRSFGLERNPSSDKPSEAVGLTGNFYRPTLFEAKLGERQKQYEQRRSGRLRTELLSMALAFLVGGSVYSYMRGYSGLDLGDMVADAVYGPLPESNITGGEAAKADAPKKGKRLGYVAPAAESGAASSPAQDCPRNLQREYFERFNQALTNRPTVDDAKSSKYIFSLQTIIDDFRKGLSSDLVIKDGTAVATLMLGSQENYISAEDQKAYERIRKVLSAFVGDRNLHLYSEGRAQDPGTLILQPALNPSNPGGK